MNLFQKLIGMRLATMVAAPSFVGVENEEGQTLAEYALILALIAIIAVVALLFLGGTITSLFSSVGSKV